MSATLEKATRRDIRRALGPQALDLIGQQAEAIAMLQRVVKAHAQDFGQYHKEQHGVHQTHRVRMETTEMALAAFVNRSFWGRLRWLVTGA